MDAVAIVEAGDVVLDQDVCVIGVEPDAIAGNVVLGDASADDPVVRVGNDLHPAGAPAREKAPVVVVGEPGVEHHVAPSASSKAPRAVVADVAVSDRVALSAQARAEILPVDLAFLHDVMSAGYPHRAPVDPGRDGAMHEREPDNMDIIDANQEQERTNADLDRVLVRVAVILQPEIHLFVFDVVEEGTGLHVVEALSLAPAPVLVQASGHFAGDLLKDFAIAENLLAVDLEIPNPDVVLVAGPVGDDVAAPDGDVFARHGDEADRVVDPAAGCECFESLVFEGPFLFPEDHALSIDTLVDVERISSPQCGEIVADGFPGLFGRPWVVVRGERMLLCHMVVGAKGGAGQNQCKQQKRDLLHTPSFRVV